MCVHMKTTQPYENKGENKMIRIAINGQQISVSKFHDPNWAQDFAGRVRDHARMTEAKKGR